MNVSVYWVLSVLCVFVLCVCLCVCVVLNQSTSKKPHYVLDLSKLIGLIVYTPSLSVRRGEGSLANNNKNMQSLCRFTGNSTKICRNRAPNEQLPIQKSCKIPALHISQKKQSTNSQRKSTDWFP